MITFLRGHPNHIHEQAAAPHTYPWVTSSGSLALNLPLTTSTGLSYSYTPIHNHHTQGWNYDSRLCLDSFLLSNLAIKLHLPPITGATPSLRPALVHTPLSGIGQMHTSMAVFKMTYLCWTKLSCHPREASEVSLELYFSLILNVLSDLACKRRKWALLACQKSCAMDFSRQRHRGLSGRHLPPLF